MRTINNYITTTFFIFFIIMMTRIKSLIRKIYTFWRVFTCAYNFNIQTPDWAQVDMTGYDRIIQEGYDYTYWSYFGAYNLYIWGDGSDTDVDQPEVGDEIKLSRYGRQLIFKVVETRNMPQGIENVSFQNNNKLYNVLGQEVGEDYKGVVIRNGKKFLK